jgi:hypothetical protein
MKTNSFGRNKSSYKFTNIINSQDCFTINNIALLSGYLKRRTKKIKPLFFFLGFLKMTSKGLKTYDDWAGEISLLCGKSVSRQAVEERMTNEASNMTRMFFEEKLKSILFQNKTNVAGSMKPKFSDIKIEDSTLLCLPEELSDFFPGNVSKGKRKAILKVHALYNFSRESFSFFNVHSFTENDQSLSADALPYLNSGDLILRDLGFQTLSVQKHLIKKGVYFISKKKANVKVYDVKTGDEINLLQSLRKNKYFDGEVLIGKQEKLQMRLVIKPLPKCTAAERRRKAKKNRDRRLNHSKEYYNMLGYSILVTNIPKEKCSTSEVIELYGLRWRIETIFKAWKSYFSIEKLIPTKTINPERIYCIIYLLLLFILLFHNIFLSKLLPIKGLSINNISILKLAKKYKQHFDLLINGETIYKHIKELIKYCHYDSRQDRMNTIKSTISMLLSLTPMRQFSGFVFRI